MLLTFLRKQAQRRELIPDFIQQARIEQLKLGEIMGQLLFAEPLTDQIANLLPVITRLKRSTTGTQLTRFLIGLNGLVVKLSAFANGSNGRMGGQQKTQQGRAGIALRKNVDVSDFTHNIASVCSTAATARSVALPSSW